MGVAYNSRIVTENLVLCLDAANTKSYPGILDNIVGWRLPSTNYIRGTLLDNDRTWSSEPSTGYSSVILNKTFNAGENFEVIAYWARDYRGIGMVYGPNVSIFDFTGYSVDVNGPYFGALNTSGFPSGYSATFFGQYHSPISGQGAQTTGYWFKWARTGNTLSLQYSATSSSGPWTNILGDVSINSTDKVIIGAGEASSNEVSDLSLISVGPGPYTWGDLSGSGYSATMRNLTASNWVLVDGQRTFETNDTNNQGFTVSNFVRPGTNRTYSIWLKSKSFSLGWQTWFDDDGERILFGTSTNTVHIYPNVNLTANLQINTWYNLTYTLSGTTAIGYVNGVSIGSGTYTSTLTSGTGDLWILGDNGSEISSCYCSYASVYNRALSAAEIQQNFNALRGRFGL